MSGSALPILPESAPFPVEHIRALNAVMAETNVEQRHWLAGFLAGYHAATALPAAAPQADAARQDPAHDPVRDRIRQRRGGRGRGEEGRRQAGLCRAAGRHGRDHPGRDRYGAPPAGDRQHLGRGRSAGAGDRVLSGAAGRRCAELRGHPVQRAGARRFELRQLLRGRPAARCAPGRARRRADRAADRLRPRLRDAGGATGRAARSSSSQRAPSPTRK